MEKIITKKEVQQKINEALSSLLLNDGFKLRKKDGFIVRKNPNKTESIYFHILNYWPLCQEVESVMFHIRFDEVENIINPILSKHGLFNMEFAKTSSTIRTWIDFNVKIDKYEDIDKFISLYMIDIKEKLLTYFEQNEDMCNINISEKSIILKQKSDLSNHIDTIMRSLILAKLCSDTDLEELCIKYKKLIKPFYGQEQQNFAAYDDLVRYLSKL
ncbi:MAG: hypothetical protein LBP63_09565 [Prevotellaceae bacterium]|jgi:hypothetical protein|nr:hypothetical protein [Prevotellaceae bacterium]